MERGYIKLWRKSLDSGLFGHPFAWTLFCYLLLSATRKPHKYLTRKGAIELAPGQYVSSIRSLAAALGCGIQQIRTALGILEKCENINTEKLIGFTIYTIPNWKNYQEGGNTEPTQPQHRANTEPTQKQEREKERKREEEIKQAAPPPYVGFNFFGFLVDALIKAGCVVTERKPMVIGMVNQRGSKVGEPVFRDTVQRYVTDKFCQDAGLSLNGFLNSFDRLATKAKGKDYAQSQDRAEAEARVLKRIQASKGAAR